LISIHRNKTSQKVDLDEKTKILKTRVSTFLCKYIYVYSTKQRKRLQREIEKRNTHKARLSQNIYIKKKLKRKKEKRKSHLQRCSKQGRSQVKDSSK